MQEATLVQSWIRITRRSPELHLELRQLSGLRGQPVLPAMAVREPVVRMVADSNTTGCNSGGYDGRKSIGTLSTLWASNPGLWGNNLSITITPSKSDATKFSLLVQLVVNGQTTTLESYSNLSVVATADRSMCGHGDRQRLEGHYVCRIRPLTPPSAHGRCASRRRPRRQPA